MQICPHNHNTLYFYSFPESKAKVTSLQITCKRWLVLALARRAQHVVAVVRHHGHFHEIRHVGGRSNSAGGGRIVGDDRRFLDGRPSVALLLTEVLGDDEIRVDVDLIEIVRGLRDLQDLGRDYPGLRQVLLGHDVHLQNLSAGRVALVRQNGEFSFHDHLFCPGPAFSVAIPRF